MYGHKGIYVADCIGVTGVDSESHSNKIALFPQLHAFNFFVSVVQMQNLLSVYKEKGGQTRVIDLENTIGVKNTCKDGLLISDGAKSFGSFVNAHPELDLDHLEISHSTNALVETGFTKNTSIVNFYTLPLGLSLYILGVNKI